jgi:hypothetical protein
MINRKNVQATPSSPFRIRTRYDKNKGIYITHITCLKTISDTDASDLNLGKEIRAGTIRFKVIRPKTLLNEFIYAAQIIAGPMIKAES